jgi:integrase
MAWVKKSYKTKAGRRHAVGYKDHEGVERSRGGFLTRKLAGDWATDVDKAAREGSDVLKEFLDRTVRGIVKHELTMQELFSLWYALDANPERDGGLAGNTWDSYKLHWHTHASQHVGADPANDYSRPGPCSRLLQTLRDNGAGPATVTRTRATLSSMLSWGVEHEHVDANGFGLIQRRRRRSTRGKRGRAKPVKGQRRKSPKHERQGRALSPRAVAAIYKAQRAQTKTRDMLRPQRDAVATLTQYLLGCRNQELWALRWEDIGPRMTTFVEVISYGALDQGKTSGSHRSVPTPKLLREVLDDYREALTAAGRAPAPDDFIFAGVHEDGHFSTAQAKSWPSRYFIPVAEALAKKPEAGLSYLTNATQYGLRRGHMSVRLRAGEDSVVIAKQCGTSVQMLHRHYADDIAEAGIDSRPLEDQLREALGWVAAEPQRRLRAV